MVWTRKRLDQGLLRQARRARLSGQLAHLDYMRALLAAAQAMNQTQVAETLGISQPAVSQACSTARALPPIPDDRLCASPEEALKRYLVGQYNTTVAAAEVARWTGDATAVLQSMIDQTHCVLEDLNRLVPKLRAAGVRVGDLQPADDGYSALKR